MWWRSVVELAHAKDRSTTHPGAARLRVEHLDRLAPSLRLRRIDLAEGQNVPLPHPAIIETLVLDDAPIQMRLAVLPSFNSCRNMTATIKTEKQLPENPRSSQLVFTTGRFEDI